MNQPSIAGVVAAVKRAMGEADRAAYQRFPEQPDDFWDDAEAWGAEFRAEVWWPVCRTMRAYRLAGSFGQATHPRNKRW